MLYTSYRTVLVSRMAGQRIVAIEPVTDSDRVLMRNPRPTGVTTSAP
ncbi:hypothetical protein AB0M32_26245 [Streptomyces sp. NPDC051985]